MITPSFALTATERVLPKLVLNFTAASLDSRVTFTRTTGVSNPATYVNSSGVITTATNNQPRFDFDPVTLICKGLLIEESRTNLFYNSSLQSISTTAVNNAWCNVDALVNVTVNYATAPDGTTTAALVATNTATSFKTIFQRTGSTTTGNYAYSIYAKPNSTDTRVSLIISGEDTTTNFVRSDFLLSGAGSVVGNTTGGTATRPTASEIKSVGNGWYRIAIYANFVTATNVQAQIYPGNRSSQTTASQTLVWGTQIEQGVFATSYIPTATAALTRNADVATITGTNFSDWFNASEGAAVVQVLPSTISGTRPAVGFDDNTANETIVLRGVAANPQLYIVDEGVAQATLDAGTIFANTTYRLGGTWKSASFATAIDGGASVSQSSGTYPTVTQARLGSDGTNYFNGWLQNLRYWPQRIIDAEVQAFSK